MIRYDGVGYGMIRCPMIWRHFFVSPGTTGLSHRTPAFAGISSDTWRVQDNDKRNARYNIEIRFAIRTVSYSLDQSSIFASVVQVPDHISPYRLGNCHTLLLSGTGRGPQERHWKSGSRRPLYDIFNPEILYITILKARNSTGPRGGTVLQAAKSPVRFSLVSLGLFIDLILPIPLWPWGRLSL